MRRFKRIPAIIVDPFDAGNDRGTETYGDGDIDTVGHIAKSVDHWEIPSLWELGIANTYPLKRVVPVKKPMGYYAVMSENNCGEDTVTKHWELMGIKTVRPLVTFTKTGFPKELIEELERCTGRRVIENKSSSRTTILDELAEEEIITGHIVVYTPADSVLQICGDGETLGLNELYRCCGVAGGLTMKGEQHAGRVIAGPCVEKKKDEFKRTSNHHDYALRLTGKTALNALKEHEFEAISADKTRGIFDRGGITKTCKSKSSVHGMEQAIDIIKGEDFEGLYFVDLVDFDALWGHHRNPRGYVKRVEMSDMKLGEALADLQGDDLLMIIADRKDNPTCSGTDHTREQVPLLIRSKRFEGDGALKEIGTFTIAGATTAEDSGVKMPEGTIGSSIPGQLP